jgi:glycine/serine hydroxymethyltransferase
MVTRGMDSTHMPQLAQYIDTVLRHEVTPALQEEIRMFAQQFRVPV